MPPPPSSPPRSTTKALPALAEFSCHKHTEPNPLSWLHANDQRLQASFSHESEKAVFFSFSIKICSEILWIRQFYLLIKNAKRGIKCYQKAPRFKTFSPKGMPPDHLARLGARFTKKTRNKPDVTKLRFGFKLLPHPPPSPRIHYQGFAGACTILRIFIPQTCEPNYTSWLRASNLQASFSSESEKAGGFSFNIRICFKILSFRQFNMLIKTTKTTHQKLSNNTKISKV